MNTEAATTSRGASAFAAFLDNHGFSLDAAAVALGASKSVVRLWRRGELRPRLEFRRAIERWTRGEVPAALWETDEDAAIVDAVVPFSPTEAA